MNCFTCFPNDKKKRDACDTYEYVTEQWRACTPITVDRARRGPARRPSRGARARPASSTGGASRGTSDTRHARAFDVWHLTYAPTWPPDVDFDTFQDGRCCFLIWPLGVWLFIVSFFFCLTLGLFFISGLLFL